MSVVLILFLNNSLMIRATAAVLLSEQSPHKPAFLVIAFALAGSITADAGNGRNRQRFGYRVERQRQHGDEKQEHELFHKLIT